MKILHITPHLGGGVGKAHSAFLSETSSGFRHEYLLLETPRDRRFAERIEAAGGTVDVARNRAQVEEKIAAADIVQIEWWNHPRLYELLATPLPAMRSVFWVHVSGLHAPYYPVGLIECAGRFVFTSPCSLSWNGLDKLPRDKRARLAVAGSGFGFQPSSALMPASERAGISYLGTVDFVKMHPQFFDIIDAVKQDEVKVALYGAFDPEGDPARAWKAMRRPERVSFEGQVADPRPMLEQSAIFFYPLRPDHYGTAENALIEAMSVGAVPLVMGNPAEAAIVRDGENGVVAADADDAAAKLGRLLEDRAALDLMSRRAMEDAATLYHPARTAQLFEDIYRELMQSPGMVSDFAAVLGREPREWFLSTQFVEPKAGNLQRFSRSGALSKGSLDHFLDVFPQDAGLLSLS